MGVSITRRLEWDAAHRVLRHESKCATLHGHRYVALLTCSAAELDDCDRVIDFGVVKERVGGWIDEHWDHTTLVNAADSALFRFCWAEYLDGRKKPFSVHGEPTAESLASLLLTVAQGLLADSGITVEKVVVYETPNCSAEVTRGG